MLGLMPSSTSHKALPLAQHGAALLPKNMPAEAHCQEDRGINAVELVFIMTFLGYFSLFNVQIVSVVSCCGFHRLLYTTWFFPRRKRGDFCVRFLITFCMPDAAEPDPQRPSSFAALVLIPLNHVVLLFLNSFVPL